MPPNQPPSHMLCTRQMVQISFEKHLEWKVMYHDVEIKQPCFAMRLNYKGESNLNGLILREIENVWFIGVNDVRIFTVKVTKDITFDLYFLLLLSSIYQTKQIIIKEVFFYFNAKTKIDQFIPNEIQNMFKTNCCKKRRYIWPITRILYRIHHPFRWEFGCDCAVGCIVLACGRVVNV